MKIAFDLSSLALWHGSKAGMRGIYRVVDSLLPEILEQMENLVCTSTENSSLATDYLRKKGLELAIRKNFLHETISRGSGMVHRFQEANMADYPANSQLTRKMSRRASTVASRLMGRIASSSARFSMVGINIFHQPAPFRIPDFIKLHSRQDFARFMTIYDFIPFSEGYPNPREARYLQSVFNSLNPDDFTICISEHVKHEACERFKMKPENMFVAPLAASPVLFYPNPDRNAIENIRQTLHLGDNPYFLSLCALDPRKNMRLLLRAFRDLSSQQANMNANLVLAGNAPPDEISKLKSYASELGIASRLLMPGFVQDRDLSALYSGALAFVFPSFAEGFGLPPLEAMQCGTPVISSDRTSLPEVVGNAGILFDPDDGNALSAAMWKLYDEPATAQWYSKAGIARASEFSWQRCAQNHISAYSHALSS